MKTAAIRYGRFATTEAGTPVADVLLFSAVTVKVTDATVFEMRDSVALQVPDVVVVHEPVAPVLVRSATTTPDVAAPLVRTVAVMVAFQRVVPLRTLDAVSAVSAGPAADPPQPAPTPTAQNASVTDCASAAP